MTTASLTPARAPVTAADRRDSAQAFLALLMRDLQVLRRNFRAFLLRTIMQPLMFVFVFNYVFPKIGQGIGAPGGGASSFGTILVPGLIAVTMSFTGVQAVALPLVQEFSFTKEIEDRVLAPLPVWAVGLGKLVNGALQAVVASLVIFPLVSLIHAPGAAPDVSLSRPLAFVAVLLLASFTGSCLGLLIGTSFESQQVPLVFSIVVLPMTMLGCIYYPWATLDPIPWLKWGVLVNPLVYMSEGMRYALTPGIPHMHPVLIFGAMTIAVVLMGGVSLRKFRSRVVG